MPPFLLLLLKGEIMKFIIARLFEGSSMAGYGVLISAFATLVASGFKDPVSWGAVVAALAAILIPDKGAAKE
jgi:hypothetical protein